MSDDEHGLPAAIEHGVEQASGLPMDDVRVRRNSNTPAQIRALDHARGTEIHLDLGQERHLPHEAWHVVQQEPGRARPATKVDDGAINDDGALEREADAMGARASGSPSQSEGLDAQLRQAEQ